MDLHDDGGSLRRKCIVLSTLKKTVINLTVLDSVVFVLAMVLTEACQNVLFFPQGFNENACTGIDTLTMEGKVEPPADDSTTTSAGDARKTILSGVVAAGLMAAIFLF